MGVYCEAHLKEGITQNRLIYQSLNIKRIDYTTQCDLCHARARFWIG